MYSETDRGSQADLIAQCDSEGRGARSVDAHASVSTTASPMHVHRQSQGLIDPLAPHRGSTFLHLDARESEGVGRQALRWPTSLSGERSGPWSAPNRRRIVGARLRSSRIVPGCPELRVGRHPGGYIRCPEVFSWVSLAAPVSSTSARHVDLGCAFRPIVLTRASRKVEMTTSDSLARS
jgi:hypothetical protein